MRKGLELTNDPLTNIIILVPLLSNEARQIISFFMQGCYLGEQLAKTKEEANT